MADSIDPRTRILIRSVLVVGIVLALLGLWAAIQGSPWMRGDEPSPEPIPADANRLVRVRGADDQVVAGTIVDVGQDPANPVEVSWHADVGVLELPAAGQDHRVRVVMPGHRVAHVPAVRGGQTIRMRPGYVVTVPLRGVPEDGLPDHVRFLLRVEPREVPIQGLRPQEIVELMANRGAPGSGPEYIPRGQFGYPVSREQAAAGIVLPSPGTYHVRWGLIDIENQTWQGLGEKTGRTFGVADQDDAQDFPLDVTPEFLQETLDRLAAMIEPARKQQEKAKQAK